MLRKKGKKTSAPGTQEAAAADRRDVRKETGAIRDRPEGRVAAEMRAGCRAVIRREVKTRPGRTEPAAIRNRGNNAGEIKEPEIKDKATKNQGINDAVVVKEAAIMKGGNRRPGRINHEIRTAEDRDPGRKDRAEGLRAIPTPPTQAPRHPHRNSPNPDPVVWFCQLIQHLKTALVISILVLLWGIIAPGCMSFQLSDESARKQFLRKGLELTTASIQVNGRAIHYAMVGLDSMPTLIFIHGSPGSWNSLSNYLKDPALLFHYRMVSVDRPGFGFSNFGEALPLAEQSLVLLPLLQHIRNGKPVYLVGHSLGGPLVVKMASDAPSEVAGIMLLAGSVDPSLEPAENWRRLAGKFPFRLLLPGAFRPSNEELLYFKKDVVSLTKDFPKVTCDVYLLHGDKDSWVPVGNVDYARKKLTNARSVQTHIFQGGNHFIPFSKQKEIVPWLIRMGAATQAAGPGD
jgi:pimeloyl-ACP methyl ester carboxylesterase